MAVEFSESLVRIGCAFVSGAILGLERETRGRPAGLRTIALVCVASALAAILSDNYYRSSFTGEYVSQNWHPDPARLAAGILTGIGFLGAGVIIQQENWVRGVTTASQIWFVTILGLCFGSGELALGGVGLIVSIVTVYCLHHVEVFMKRDLYAILTVEVALDGAKAETIASTIRDLDVNVMNTEFQRNLEKQRDSIVYRLRYKKTEENKMAQRVVSKVSGLQGIASVHWK